MRLLWDLETNGLLDDVTQIHCLVMMDLDTKQTYSAFSPFVPDSPAKWLTAQEGLKLLSEASERIGHNTIKYDLQVLRKLYPLLELKGKDTDTLLLAQLIHSDIKTEDQKAIEQGRLNRETFKHLGKSLFGSHSLAAWGYRLGEHKTEYTGSWEHWSPEMQRYAEQDILTTHKLYQYLKPSQYSQKAIDLEHRVAEITAKMEAHGIPFDLKRASELQATLVQRKFELSQSLLGLFPDWTVETDRFIAKVDNKTLGRKKGDEVIKTKVVQFNPGSREHIAKCLIDKYGWKPKEFTPTGRPQISEEVLEGLKYPEAIKLSEYFIVCKTLSQLAEGNGSWLNFHRQGVIHAHYNTLGTVTGRCSHSSPNIGQVPAVDKPYGRECRSLFGKAPVGYKLLGTDMSGLELRCLGHYMAHFDGGAYAKEVVSGDVHTLNQKAAGLPTRDNAKTFISMG